MDLIGPLLPASARPYAKAVLALLGVVVSVLAATLTDVAWLPVVVQVLAAVGVYAVPNAEPDLPAAYTESAS